MIISTSSHNVLLTSDLDDFVARTMRGGLGAFAEEVLSVDLFMQRVNREGGKVDNRVIIRIHLRDRRQLAVETSGDDLLSAIRRGAKCAKRLVRRSLAASRRTARPRAAAHFGHRGRPSEVSA